MDDVFLGTWHALKATPGVFRNQHYDATARRVLPLPHDDGTRDVATGVTQPLSAQHNPHHLATKRPTTMSQEVVPVTRPFDPALFNFKKASPREIVVRVATSRAGGPSLVAAGEAASSAAAAAVPSSHPIFVNVNPLLDGHGLLTPSMEACHPQVIAPAALEAALQVLHLSTRPDFRIGFNSLGAWASVNHLHLHTFYVREAFAGGRMPVETAAREPLVCVALGESDPAGRSWGASRVLKLERLAGWPTGGFVFSVVSPGVAAVPPAAAPPGSSSEEGGAGSGAGARPGGEAAAAASSSALAAAAAPLDTHALAVLAQAAGGFAAGLASSSIAHNLLLTRDAVFVIPRALQEGRGAEEGRLVVALAEVCGLGIVYSAEAWAALTHDSYMATLAGAALPSDTLAVLVEQAAKAVAAAEGVVAATWGDAP